MTDSGGARGHAKGSNGLGFSANRTWMGGNHLYKWPLATETTLGEHHWPAESEPDSTNWLKRTQIQKVLLDVLTAGLFSVEVVEQLPPASVMGVMVPQEKILEPEEVARELAREIDKHELFDRSEKAIEGLAHAIRQDLERMAYQNYFHPCVHKSKYLSYLHGKGLKNRLDAMVLAVPKAAARGEST